jgi:RHS repeat-associated protein
MVRSITQGTRTTTYTLDVVSNRIRSWTDNGTGTTLAKTNHYAGDSDSPVWTDEGDGNYSRVIAGLGGVAAVRSADATQYWTLSNLNGDLVAGMAQTGTALAYSSEYTENGLPRNPADAGNRRYGWLGSAQRAADTPGGLTLMGARLYAPGSGRFLSTDPVYGGSANLYEYCAGDSVGCSDTDGTFRIIKKRKWWKCFLWYCNGYFFMMILLSKRETDGVVTFGDIALFWLGIIGAIVGAFSLGAGLIIAALAAVLVGIAWTVAKIAQWFGWCETITISAVKALNFQRADVWFGMLPCRDRRSRGVGRG